MNITKLHKNLKEGFIFQVFVLDNNITNIIGAHAISKINSDAENKYRTDYATKLKVDSMVNFVMSQIEICSMTDKQLLFKEASMKNLLNTAISYE